MERMHGLGEEALSRFQALLARARATRLQEPAAMALATVDPDGQPSVRTVLLRGVDARGFVFFTNCDSRKGRELAANPRAALCFHWDPLAEQVRVEGTVEVVGDEESDAYWVTRPRESRLGAWASLQSRPLADRSIFEQRLAEVEAQFPGDDVPRPPFWHGYRVLPSRIEFWRGQPARLHDRTLYEVTESGWIRYDLYP